ncbi:MOSC N-terminal beta barrel domain-containing protein [Marinomonas ostreistagni]|uniref:MOSC N-terminal beta barrel domain-containing protein n=1 Tax=Marinomonas ostreistagni TaxID=359209 RepID=UPI00194EA53C|nr:MOSC domain-containing protein [Marinomonas ostreistagni]
MAINVSHLAIYPIKSCKPVPLNESDVFLQGLKFDRRYMLVDENGQFVTAREYPQLSLVKASVDKQVLSLVGPEDDDRAPLLLMESEFADEHIDVQVWDDSLKAQKTTAEADQWFSEILGIYVHLVFFAKQSERFTSRRQDSPVTFADGYPFLLTTQASLDELNQTTEHLVEMERFRPNIVVEGNEAFAEDTWKRIRIGEVEFTNVKPCVRCNFTTLDPKTAIRSPKSEPLKALAKFRKLDKEGVTFGINLVAENEGVIRSGDTLEVLEYQESYDYQDKRQLESA